MGRFDKYKANKLSNEPRKTITSLVPETQKRQPKSKIIGIGLTEQEEQISLYYSQLCVLYGVKDKNAGAILTLLSTFISDNQELVIQHHQKSFISKALGLSVQRIEQIIYTLKKANLISHTGERSIYIACPYVLPKYKWNKLDRVIMDYKTRTVSFFEEQKDL